MKQIWILLLLLAIVSIPALAQLTPHDSTITNNGGAGITTNVALDKNKTYLISGFVYVRNGASLTIPAGSLLLGEYSTEGSLIIERGGKIFANGTAEEPIVFTSQFAPGSRNRGDWGGIVICGTASNNRPGGNFIPEGNIGSIAGYGDALFPTVNDDDNSGVMRYVRIEFPGYPYTANNEINGLTLAAVGRGTTLEHIQVSYSDDDAFEFFGGTVNAKWLIAYKARDDNFDTDFGYTGKIQFGVVYVDPGRADISQSEAFETDNDGTGTTASPRTEPVLSNITVVGPKRSASDVSGTNFDALFYYGIHHRRATRHNLFNSVIMGFDEGGIFLDGATVQGDTANFRYRNNVFTGMTNLIEPASFNAWFTSYGNSSLPGVNDVLLKAPHNETSPVLIPQAGSVLLSGASFSDPRLSDPFFTPTTYRGAFSGNGAERWDLGWANYDPQGITYKNPNLVWSGIIYLTSGAGARKSVVIGRGIGATDGIDVAFQESIVPTPPPTGIIYFTCDLGSAGKTFIDIRSAATTTSLIIWTLNIQENAPSSVDEVLSWDPNLLGPGAFTLKILGQPDVNMKTSSSAIVPAGIALVTIEHDTRIVSVSYQYGANWNLVSFPGVHPTNMNVNTLWARRDLAFSVFKYTGSYVAVTEAEVGTGYWMNHTPGNATHLTYTWNSGSTRLNYAPMKPFQAAAGWNMIGSYEFEHSVEFIRTNPENRKSSASVFRYVPGGGYSAVTTLNPGFGYWINLTGAADIYLPGPFFGTLGKDPFEDIIKEDWGRIVITDAAGQNYTLYAADASVDLNMFELPPLPPAGMFDVRFGSQRFAEDLNAGTQTIHLNGVVYPVTISVTGMNLKLEDAIDGSYVKTTINSGNSYVLNNRNVNILKVGSDAITPTAYSLEQNYPNPFNPSTTIKFAIPEVSDVKLTIYNSLGQKIAELVNSTLEAGSYTIDWNASNVASGLYFYELNTGDFSSVKKMMLLK
jgi:hypothetical protein